MLIKNLEFGGLTILSDFHRVRKWTNVSMRVRIGCTQEVRSKMVERTIYSYLKEYGIYIIEYETLTIQILHQ